MKVILDTNIYISALLFSPNMAQKVFLLLEEHDVFISPEIIQELYEKLEKKFKVPQEIYTLLDIFLEEITVETIQPGINISKCRDPKDDHLLEFSESIKADYCITGDNDLLVLKEWNLTKICTIKKFEDDFL